MSEDQIREVGKALLPYLRDDLTDVELGTACHDAVAALNRVAGVDRLRAEVARLTDAIEQALDDMRDDLCVCLATKEQMRAVVATPGKEE